MERTVVLRVHVGHDQPRPLAEHDAYGVFFYQVSGIYASASHTADTGQPHRGRHGDPWYACGYLVATVVLSVGATVLLKPK